MTEPRKTLEGELTEADFGGPEEGDPNFGTQVYEVELPGMTTRWVREIRSFSAKDAAVRAAEILHGQGVWTTIFPVEFTVRAPAGRVALVTVGVKQVPEFTVESFRWKLGERR